jgi:hypothetical protein
MSRITRDSSVLNQFGSPSINSNILANRPTFGQPGRLFVSTDTLAIFRDTGSAWDNLTAGGGIGTLQQVTTLGNTTTLGIFAGASGSLTAGRLLEVKGKSLLTDTSGNVLYIGLPTITPNTATLDVYGYTILRNTVNTTSNLGPLLYSQYELNYAGTQLSGFANSIFAQDIYNVSANTTVASSTQSGTSFAVNTYKFTTASTITFTQPGGTIRAASAITAYSQFQNTAAGTITHAAGLCILGVENIGGSALNITNNYQLLINASNEFASTATVTNRFGVYQSGTNDVNYFAANTIIGGTNPVDNGYKLQVNDKAYIDFAIIGQVGFGTSIVQFSHINRSTTADYSILSASSGETYINAKAGQTILFRIANVDIARFTANGDLLLGTTSNSNNVKLKVNGVQEWSNITLATGAHTSSGNYLPIYVNNVQYYLDLLN